MTANEYNGWTNYETWLVSLWLDNDYGTQSSLEEWAHVANRDGGILATPIQIMAESIQDFVEACNPLKDAADVYSDLLNAALAEVDYRKIAEHVLTYLPLEDEDEDNDDSESDND